MSHALPRAVIDARSPALLRLFAMLFRRDLARSFHAVRCSGDIPTVPGPLVIFANHPSWWDGELFVWLSATRFKARRGFAPMNARMLRQYGPRLRLASAPPLPPGWSGKQHACHVLGQMTEAKKLIFLDADVRLEPDAAARLCGALGDAALVSGVPRQRMASLAELMIIPMINAVLLSYLPIPLARRDGRPALAAACGQMIAVRADAYRLSGGHAGIRSSLHDGLTLPRLFRRAGLRTDLVAGSGLASCRIYAGWRATVRGTTKNATEGFARPVALPIWTTLLLGGHVVPWLLLVGSLVGGDTFVAVLSALACTGPMVARSAQAVMCREPPLSVPLHPFGVALLVALQWLALGRKWAGRTETWRGRSYPAGG